jgi:hypothetical protein
MSNPGMRHPEPVRHPEEDLMLRYLDGELSGRKARHVRSHLEACWQCRSELEALEATIADCVRYRRDVLAEALPPAPAQWKPVDFDAVDAELAGEPLMARLARWISPSRNTPVRWALAASASLALVLVAIHKLGETPKVEAAALLKKAVAISETRPHTAKRLRITTSRRQITRVVYGAATPAPEEAEIAALFRAAHYDWTDPLSARAYADWRDRLSRKQDRVETPDKDSYIIKTTTADGELASAMLKMRATDFEAIEGRFEFRNREWVEMTELVDQQTQPASTFAGTTGSMSRQPDMLPAPSHASAAPEPPEPSAVAEQLQVFAALHQVGADLGDPIEVNREGRDVVVSGTGVPQHHQQQLHALLDRLPHVVVRFNDPSLPASNPPAEEPATRDAAGPEAPKYPARLEARLGGRPQFERFSGQVLDWTDAAMARVYALRRLAQQFPADAEGRMRPEERRTLHGLGAEHATALAKELQKISKTVNPILTSLGAAATPGAAGSSPAWQSATESLFTSGRRVETLLAEVLGVTGATANRPASQDAASQLLTALAQFTVDNEQCLRHLSYDDVRQSK